MVADTVDPIEETTASGQENPWRDQAKLKEGD